MNVNKTNYFTHSHLLTKTETSTGVLTQQLLKVVRLLRLSGMHLVKWLLKLSRRTTLSSPTNLKDTYQLNLTSDVFGNITVSTISVLDSLNLKQTKVSQRLMLMLSESSLASLAPPHLTHT